jgi:hypothetical protein
MDFSSYQLVILGRLTLCFTVAEKDDAPGVVALNILLIIGPFTVGVFASILQKLLINAIDYKSETGLTI